MFVTSILPHIQLLRLDRPIGTWLLLWPTVSALWLAGARGPDIIVFLVFVLGVVLTRSLGCVINDLADRRYDRHVERTRNRPLANGSLTPLNAIAWFVLLSILSCLLLSQLKWETCLIACIAASMIIAYPFFKRFFPIPQLWLGCTFSMSIPMAFVEMNGSVSVLAVIFYISCVLWIMAFDIIYALADRRDDRMLGLKSGALWFGRYATVAVSAFYLMVFLIWLWVFWKAQAHLLAVVLLMWIGYLLGKQVLLIRRDVSQSENAFYLNHWVGLTLFIALVLCVD